MVQGLLTLCTTRHRQGGSSFMTEYERSGVDYSVLDGVKRAAVARAAATTPLLAASGAREFEGSRGATAYVVEVGGLTLAMVTEGLGTKSIITETYLEQSGESRFADIAVDAVAAIVNDVISVGANPMVITAYFATGDAAWYTDERKSLGSSQAGSVPVRSPVRRGVAGSRQRCRGC